jgi:hypothetical protein
MQKITALEYLALGYKRNKQVVIKNGDKVVETVIRSADSTYYEVKHTDGTWDVVGDPFTVEPIKPEG